MRFFQNQFDESLQADVRNDGREVVIGSALWLADEVLKELDIEAYEDAFYEWKLAREKELIHLANLILKKYNCAKYFDLLVQDYKKGLVLPFVGAGMSASSGYPTWHSFLKQLCKEVKIADRPSCENLLSSSKFEEAAQFLKDKMTPTRFTHAIRGHFAVEKPIEGPIQILPYLCEGSAITINFDYVLEKVYTDAGHDFEEIFGARETELFLDALTSNKRVLLHFHGKADRSDNRVLTHEEYNEYYEENGEKFKKLIQAIGSKKSMLFLGCSLSVDRLFRTMCDISQVGSWSQHYAFLGIPKSMTEDERIERSDELSGASITPIWYPSDLGHDEFIEALLCKLRGGLT